MNGNGRAVVEDVRKYRWTAIYSDGTQFEEPDEDVSATDPLRPAKNDIDEKLCIAIVLTGPNPVAASPGIMGRLQRAPKTVWAVDLRDGALEHDGHRFFVGDPHARFNERRFFMGRRVQQDVVVRGVVGEDGKISETRTPGDRRVWQQLGWIGTDKEGRETRVIVEFA